MKDKLYLFIYLLTAVTSNADEDSLTVELTQGHVKGYKEEGKNYYAFYGIPYATAPTGGDKFKAPLPPPSWTNILEATNKDIICPQSSFLTTFFSHLKSRNLIMDENCLNVNIFTPGTEGPLPVFVYIHGGAFQIGFGDMSSHEPMLRSGKFVEVNFNYRLGIPGFLCLGTEDVPGNAGMKDQVAALRWVKENIAKFGGNPDDVTLAGYSAGSASVDLQFLSHTTKGLFNKIIPESGNAIAAWAIQIDPLYNAINFAEKHKFVNTGNVYDLENFYKSAPLDILFSEHFFFAKDHQFGFVPCIERKNEESFLDELPLNILMNRDYEKMPALHGMANMEGLFRVFQFEQWKDEMNEKFSDFLPVNLQFVDDAQREEVAGVIKNFYFGDEKVGADTMQAYVNYFTDILFSYPLLKTVALLSEAENEVYEYKYSFVDTTPHPFDPYNLGGAHHCAQSGALSYNLFTNDTGEITKEYSEMRRIMSDLWVNFITTGKPVRETSAMFPSGWPTVTLANNAYMDLKNVPELKTDMVIERYKFWDHIYGKYYRAPISPPAPK